MTPRWVTVGVAFFLALTFSALAWWWLLAPFPDEQQVATIYNAHEEEFATLADMTRSPCTGQLTPEVSAIARRIDSRMLVLCNYDGTVRFILGVRGLMAIGPERVIGLTFIPGDTSRKGMVVDSLKPHMRDVGDVWLRPIRDHWYIFIQNTD